MNINPEYLARFRAVIVGLDNAPDYATLQFLIGELEELEQTLLASHALDCNCATCSDHASIDEVSA